MLKIQNKNFNASDETVPTDNGKIEVLNLGDIKIKRYTLNPGWNWSRAVKIADKTETCQKTHLYIHIQGHLKVKMDDGTERKFGPGDVSLIPPGHDGFVVSNEPAEIIEIVSKEARDLVSSGSFD